MDLLSLPVVMIENIISFLSYDEIAKTRVVSKAFNDICMRSLNRGFVQTERRHAIALKTVKSQLPRRESERRMGLFYSSDEFDDPYGYGESEDEYYYGSSSYDEFDEDEDDHYEPSDPVDESPVRSSWLMQPPPTDLISMLPIEIFQKILSYVKGSTLSRCLQVSTHWRQQISQSDVLWQNICKKESDIMLKATKAKEVSYAGTTWYSIYRNLKMLPKITKHCKTQLTKTEFVTDFNTTADLNQGILLVNGKKMSKLLDVNQFRYKPVTINGNQVCQSIANKNTVTVLQVKEDKSSTLYVQRTVQSDMMSKRATFCNISVFHLMENELYYVTDKNVIFKVDLKSMYFFEELLVDISEAVRTERLLSMSVRKTPCFQVDCFGENGHICVFKYNEKNEETVNSYNSSYTLSFPSYIQQKYGFSICDSNNYIMYSENRLIWRSGPSEINYDKKCTNVCLHNDMIVFSTHENVIQMFKVRGPNPATVTLGSIPKRHVIEKIRVCDSNAGPIIMVSALRTVFMLKTGMFYEEYPQASVFDDEALYERLLELRDRLETRHRTPKRRVLKRKLV